MHVLQSFKLCRQRLGYKEKKDLTEAKLSEEASPGQLFYSCMSIKHDSKNTWCLDSSCSNDMTWNKEFFAELMKDAYQVKFGDGNFKSYRAKASELSS